MWQGLLLAAASLSLTFLLLEIVARIFMPHHAPILLRDGIYINTLPRVTGFSLTDHSHNGGKRLEEHKPEGEVRIFVLGESSVEGNPFCHRASPPTMLFDFLAESGTFENIKIVNMGRGGSISASTYYHLLLLRRYEPDYIIFYMGTNDEPEMPGEQCMPIRHPRIYRMWRSLVEHSWLLWTVRSLGPGLLPRGNPIRQTEGWDCPGDPFPLWTDILVRVATETGARVIVTSPVKSDVAAIEPGIEPTDDGSLDFSSMRDSYRRLLVCRLSDPCDFSAAFKMYSSDSPTAEWRGDVRPSDDEDVDEDEGADELDVSPIDENIGLLENYAKAWKKSADRFGADFIDFHRSLREASQHRVLAEGFFTDEVHLTLKGYAFLARHWQEHLEARLEGSESDRVTVPTPDVYRRYAKANTVTPAAAGFYLRQGALLTILPTLEFASTDCPQRECREQARVALGWIRQQIGLDADLPPALLPMLTDFDPVDRKP